MTGKGNIRFTAGFMLALVASFSMPVSAADDGIGQLAGVGGVARDAERRALTAAPTEEEPTTAAEAQANADSERNAENKGKLLGEVAAINITGSTEFATREHLGSMIIERLGEGAKYTGEIADAIKAVRDELMKKGYYLLRINLARNNAYNRETKTLSLVVDEGRFGKLNIKFGENGEEDGYWFSRAQIVRRFKDIAEGDTFDYNRFRGILFDVNSHPDLTIDTAIDVRNPMEGEGEHRRITRYADINLTVNESCPIHLLWEINNYGMEELDRWQTSLTAQYLNLTHHDDVLTISPAMNFGAEMFSLAGSYLLPHHWWLGGNTTVYAGYSNLNVDNIISRLDLEGIGYFVGLQHSENLIWTDRHQLAISLGCMWRYIEDSYTALGYKLNERGASILPITLALSYTARKPDAWGGRNFATVQGVFNIMNSGDSLDSMWMGAEANYWLFRAQVARLQPLFGTLDEKTMRKLHQWMLFLKLEGQYTSDTLIPVEKLALGGYNCLRGYRTRSYLGDYGVYGTIELRTPILVDTFAALFGDRTDKNAIDRLQLLGFCDFGVTQYNELPSGFDDNGFLCSIGIGARFAVTKYMQLKCDLAFPLVDDDNGDDKDCEVYVSAQFQF